MKVLSQGQRHVTLRISKAEFSLLSEMLNSFLLDINGKGYHWPNRYKQLRYRIEVIHKLAQETKLARWDSIIYKRTPSPEDREWGQAINRKDEI